MSILKKLTGRLGPLTKDYREKGSVLKIAFFVLLFFLPLYPKFPLTEVAGTYVSIRLEDWVVLAAVLAWGIWQMKKGFPIFRQKIFKLFLIYWLAGLVSLASSIWITRAVDWRLGLFHFFRRIEYMSVFLVAFDAFNYISTLELSFGLSFAVMGVFAYGLGQKYLGLPVISTMNEEFSKGLLLTLDKWTRISSTFAGHYDLAAWLVMILALLPALVASVKNKLLKVWLFLAGVGSFYLLVLTASRISYVAYLVGITVTLILLKRWIWLPLVLGVSLLCGFQSKELNTRLASSLASVVPQNQEGGVDKSELPSVPTATISPEKTPVATATPTPEPEIPGTAPKKERKIVVREVRTWPKPEEVAAAAARSSEIRFAVEWPRAVRAFLRNPILGSGFSSLGLATDNDYLRILGETGLLGFLSFGLIVFHLIISALLSLLKGKKVIMAGFLGLILGFLANGIFIDVFAASKDAFYFWLLAGGLYRVSINE
ncbi:MAG: O-antigen ligase family protein [Candidatus Shapirobacteria bacterium]